jgi:hypothetical protein
LGYENDADHDVPLIIAPGMCIQKIVIRRSSAKECLFFLSNKR